MKTQIAHYLEVVSHPDFRIVGFTVPDLLEIKKALDTYALDQRIIPSALQAWWEKTS